MWVMNMFIFYWEWKKYEIEYSTSSQSKTKISNPFFLTIMVCINQLSSGGQQTRRGHSESVHEAVETAGWETADRTLQKEDNERSDRKKHRGLPGQVQEVGWSLR